MKKGLLIAAGVVALAVLLGVGVLAWGYQYLQSPAGLRWVVGQANEQVLSDQKIQMAVESGGISLLSGIKLQNIKVQMEQGGKPLEIQIGELVGEWNISFVTRHLQMKKLYLTGLEIKGELAAGGEEAQVQVGVEAPSGPFGFLEDLPVSVEIEDCRISQSSIDLVMDQGEDKTHIVISKLEEQLIARVEDKHLFVSSQMAIEQNVKQQVSKLDLALNLENRLVLDLKLVKSTPQLVMENYGLKLQAEMKGPQAPLRAFSLTGEKIADGNLSHKWQARGVKLGEGKRKDLEGELDWTFEFPMHNLVTRLVARMGGEPLLNLSNHFVLADQHLKTKGEVVVPREFRPADIGLSPLAIDLEVRLGEMKPKVSVVAEKVSFQGQEFKTLVELTADVLDATKPKFDIQVFVADQKWVDLKGQAEVTETVSAMDFDLHATPAGPLWQKFNPGVIKLPQGLNLRGRAVAGAETQIDVRVDNQAPSEKAHVDLQARLAANEDLIIQKLSVNYMNDDILFDLSGRYNLARERGQLKGKLEIKGAGAGLEAFIPNSSYSGRVLFPFELAINRTGTMALNGALEFSSFSFSMPKYRVSGLNGAMAISEEFKVMGDKFSFSRLLQRNAFERVDFESFRPLLASKKPLKIKSIHVEQRAFGPFVGFVSLHQNLLSLHKFDLQAGGARFAGESYVDLQPQNLQLGFLMRFSQVDFLKLLPDRFLTNLKPGPPLHGRTNLLVDLTKASVVGRADVLEISSNQLLAMLNIVDPEYKDDKINSVRTALAYAHPTYVGLDFNHSYVDVQVDTNVGRLPQVKSIPIGSALVDVSTEVNKVMAEVPLL